MCAPCGFSPSRSQKPGQSGEAVGGHCEDGAGAHLLNAAIDGLGHSADGFDLAESLLDAFVVLDRQGVALVHGRSGIDC